jgi:superfamily II DNA/RNA helicase
VSPARHPVRALILTPTRELADQVADNVRQYATRTPLRSAVVFGGVDMDPQTNALRTGVEVLTATPGRLLDHLQQKNTSLGQVEVVVLDEADRMLDMGFLPDISRILNLLPQQRQSLMFSATFSAEIKKLAANFLHDPVLVEVAQRNSTADTVRQELMHVHESEKYAALLTLLADPQISQALVFVNAKIGARRLARQLQRDGVNADEIHGDKTQDERMKALDAFKAGTVRVLVATDVAARGLDITELPAVINYDVPFAPEDYIHRIGRTGRAGAEGRAITIATGADDKAVAAIEKLIKRVIERSRVQPGPAPHRPRREEGRERRGRAPASSRGAAAGERGSSRGAAAGERGSSRSASAGKPAPIDEFFLKPYEPSASASEPEAASGEPARAAGRPRVPALLGGTKR